MPIKATIPITIAATPEQVWPWVANIEKHPQWSPKSYSVELVSGEPDTVGATYRSVGWVPGDSHHSNDVTITEVVPLKRFALTAEDSSGVFKNSYDLKAVPGGTEVTFHIEFPELRGAAKFFAPIAFPIVGTPDLKKRLKMLKEKAEASK
jgi:uncharacterized protein YndB with AHSA1/START domain